MAGNEGSPRENAENAKAERFSRGAAEKAEKICWGRRVNHEEHEEHEGHEGWRVMRARRERTQRTQRRNGFHAEPLRKQRRFAGEEQYNIYAMFWVLMARFAPLLCFLLSVELV
jgi:hypothetical protein